MWPHFGKERVCASIDCGNPEQEAQGSSLMSRSIRLSDRWSVSLLVGCLAWTACLALPAIVVSQEEPPADPSSGPQYREISGVAEPARARVEVPRMLADGVVTNEAIFDDFWKYLSAEFTLAKNASSLPDARRDMRRFLARATGAARQRLLENLLTNMRAMARDAAEGERNFSPAVRVNALLMIGDLNEREPNFRGEGAVPYPAALPALLEYISPERPVTDLNDALRVAALAGVLRHAQEKAGPANPARDEAVRLLQELSQAENPPAGRSEEIHNWLRDRASQILAAWGAPANQAAAG